MRSLGPVCVSTAALDRVQGGRPPPHKAAVPLKTQLAFERNGLCVIKSSLPAERLQHLRQQTINDQIAEREYEALQHRVRVLVSPKAAASCRSAGEAKRLLAQHRISVGFLQFFNLHRCQPVGRDACREHDANLCQLCEELASQHCKSQQTSHKCCCYSGMTQDIQSWTPLMHVTLSVPACANAF